MNPGWCQGRSYFATSQNVRCGHDECPCELDTERHHKSSCPHSHRSLTLIPSEKRVQAEKRSSETAIKTGICAAAACLITSINPRPSSSRFPKRLIMTISAPSLIAKDNSPLIFSNCVASRVQRDARPRLWRRKTGLLAGNPTACRQGSVELLLPPNWISPAVRK